jgi:hypothetical protein
VWSKPCAYNRNAGYVGLWAVSYLAIRILPIPWLLVTYYDIFIAGNCGLSGFHRVLGAITVPLPFGLNLFWFSKIVTKLMRTLNPGREKRGSMLKQM